MMLVRPIDPGSNPFAEPYRFDLAVRPCNGVSRTELVHYPVNGTPGGAKYFYRWSTLFPLGESEFNSAFPIGPGTQGIWQVFTQWHQASNTGSPPIAFSAKREKSSNAPYIGLELSMPGTPYPIGVWKAPFTYNEWHNFVVSVVYSNSSSQGEVGLWYSTGWAIPPQAVQTWNLKTTASTNPNDKTTGPYLKHGLYRSQKYYGQRHSYVAHCGMVEGDSLAAVLANP
ncbi:polysaccharide lyase [Myxococcus sp. RHST-1-4]|nr:polysaccharide lyase [Myxococcus sp. RHSTA-1-4]